MIHTKKSLNHWVETPWKSWKNSLWISNPLCELTDLLNFISILSSLNPVHI